MSTLIVLFFFGGWLPIFGLTLLPSFFWFSFKILIFLFLFILVRASVPRYRYDQLMQLGWKTLLPLSLGFLFFSSSTSIAFYYIPF